MTGRGGIPASGWRRLLLALAVVPAVLAILLVLHATAETTSESSHVLSEVTLADSSDLGGAAAAPDSHHLVQCGSGCVPDDGLVALGCALLLIVLLLVIGVRIVLPPEPRGPGGMGMFRPLPRLPIPLSPLALSISRT